MCLFAAEQAHLVIWNKFLIYNYDDIVIDRYHPALETGGSIWKWVSKTLSKNC